MASAAQRCSLQNLDRTASNRIAIHIGICRVAIRAVTMMHLPLQALSCCIPNHTSRHSLALLRKAPLYAQQKLLAPALRTAASDSPRRASSAAVPAACLRTAPLHSPLLTKTPLPARLCLLAPVCIRNMPTVTFAMFNGHARIEIRHTICCQCLSDLLWKQRCFATREIMQANG